MGIMEQPEYEKLEEYIEPNTVGSYNLTNIALNQIAALLQYAIKRIDSLEDEILNIKTLILEDEEE